MELSDIYTLLAALLPAITSVATTIVTLIMVYKKVKGSIDTSSHDIKVLKEKTVELLKENQELKKMIKLKIDKISDKEEK